MSGIAGYVGDAAPGAVERMLGPIGYRGDQQAVWTGAGAGLGVRWWSGRPFKTQGVYEADGRIVVCAGSLVPAVENPAAELLRRLDTGDLGDLDGAFAAAVFDTRARTLTLIRDPFGVRSLYVVEHGGTFWFATELKQLLAVEGLPVELDLRAIHAWLTFSFVPGEAVPIRGVRRLLPGTVLTRGTSTTTRAYADLREQVDPELADQAVAARTIFRLGRRATRRRVHGEERVGLALSGGLDSAAIAVWLQQVGVAFTPFHLDFGDTSVDRESADEVAGALGLTLRRVPVDAARVEAVLDDLVWKLDLPFGDAVTGPQYLLAQAGRAEGLATLFNGEGGDQLFGGWTSKPMVAAALYGGVVDEETPEEQYLRAYHRFYGLEDELYTPAFRAEVGPAGQRRALLAPYLSGDGALMSRVRITDIRLKGSQNILPRAERAANAFALDARMPLFDRALANASFALPLNLKLHGACEKYVLKLAMQRHLPESVVWRRKFGMSVPLTDWLIGPRGSPARTPFADRLDALLDAVRARGLFQVDYVARLRSGQDEPTVTRRRRVGEKLWALLMIEAWMQRFVDRRGAA